MECEFRANLTQEEYDGLQPGEFRFDYESWCRRLGYTKKQIERAINELTRKKIVIVQTFKGVKGNCSKYFLLRFKEKKKEQNKEKKRSRINDSITGVEGIRGEEKEQNKEKKKEHSSQYNNLNIISNNIYSHWNSKKIIVHRALSKEIEKAIEKALKKYSESEIIQAIDIYSEILNSDYYFSYKWSLKDFLNRSNGISTFMVEGSNKCNYEDYKRKNISNNKNMEVHKETKIEDIF